MSPRSALRGGSRWLHADPPQGSGRSVALGLCSQNCLFSLCSSRLTTPGREGWEILARPRPITRRELEATGCLAGKEAQEPEAPSSRSVWTPNSSGRIKQNVLNCCRDPGSIRGVRLAEPTCLPTTGPGSLWGLPASICRSQGQTVRAPEPPSPRCETCQCASQKIGTNQVFATHAPDVVAPGERLCQRLAPSRCHLWRQPAPPVPGFAG